MECKIGCSLPFSLLSGRRAQEDDPFSSAFGSRAALLLYLSEQVDTVELRSVNAKSDPSAVCEAVRLLHRYGISATLHGALSRDDDFFAPYLPLIDSGLQSVYNITVHPFESVETTERMLRDICERIEAACYPLFITLENQRLKATNGLGVCDEIEAIVRAIDSPHLGICFDFGHQLSNERKLATDAIGDGFVARVRHTHIHAMCDGVTHFPLNHGDAELQRNLSMLYRHGYRGVLSLELSPERYREKADIKRSLVESISILKAAARQIGERERTLAFYENGYADAMRRLRNRFERADACVGLICPAGYVIKLGKTRIAVDPAPFYISKDPAATALLCDWIGGFDALILTHAHGDHYDRRFLAAMPPHVRRLVPDFMECDGATSVHDGATLKIGDVTVEFFESAHRTVPEYGFSLSYRGERYLFPADVRDYDFEFRGFDRVSVLFAHLWLGRASALCGGECSRISDFCRFVRRFGAKKCYLAHLYDAHRDIRNMWTRMHTDAVARELPEAVPLMLGDLIYLS